MPFAFPVPRRCPKAFGQAVGRFLQIVSTKRGDFLTPHVGNSELSPRQGSIKGFHELAESALIALLDSEGANSLCLGQIRWRMAKRGFIGWGVFGAGFAQFLVSPSSDKAVNNHVLVEAL